MRQQLHPRTRGAQWTYLLVLLVLMGVLLLWPSHVDQGIDPWIARTLSTWHRVCVPMWVDYTFIERAANVVLFMPFGAVAASLLRPHYWWMVVVVALLMSTTVELVQLFCLPGRTGSVSDVVTNMIGAAAGAGVLLFVRGRSRRRLARTA